MNVEYLMGIHVVKSWDLQIQQLYAIKVVEFSLNLLLYFCGTHSIMHFGTPFFFNAPLCFEAIYEKNFNLF